MNGLFLCLLPQEVGFCNLVNPVGLFDASCRHEICSTTRRQERRWNQGILRGCLGAVRQGKPPTLEMMSEASGFV